MALRLFSKSQKPSVQNAAPPLGVVGFTGPGPANWSARNTSALTRSGFLNNPIGYRSLKMLSESAAMIGFFLQGPDVRYSEHPLLKLLQRPNANQARYAFFEAFYTQLMLSGDGFVKIDWLDETPNALHLLRSERMSIIPDAQGWPAGYEYRAGKQKLRYHRNEILHIKLTHPQDDHYGLSPFHAAASAVDVHNAASQWSKALLDNAARPSGALVYKGVDGTGNLSQSQYSRLIDEIECNHQGSRNAGRPMLLEGGLDWKPMGFSPSDMEFHRTKDAAAREIALALGIPPMLLGIPGDNSYANYQEANRAFFRLTILPLVHHVVGEFSHALCGHSDLEFRVDTETVPALASEREADWRRVANAEFLSEAEKRQLLGFPAEKEG